MPTAIWGLDFGVSALKVVRGNFEKKTGAITVDLFDQIVYGELPCGYDASPVEKQREGIIEFRKRHQIERQDILCVSVTGSEVFSRFINLPPVPGRLGEIIRYEAGQQIPFDLNDVLWDYQPVKDELEDGEEIEVGLFAIKQRRVDELLDVLGSWRDNLRVVQNAPLAVFNLLEYENRLEEPTIVLDIGASTTDVLVVDPPQFWVRSLLVAGNDLSNALVKKFGVSFEEAEQIKPKVARSRHREQIMRILQPVFGEIASEIQRSLGYYKSLSREVKFEKMILLGSAVQMTGTQRMLARRLQYKVEGFSELRHIQVGDGVDEAELKAALPALVAPLGLLVQGAAQARVHINMVPEQIMLKAAMSEKKPWLLGAAVGLLLVSGLFVASQYLYGEEIRKAQQGYERQLEDVKGFQKWIEKYKEEQSRAKKVRGSDLLLLTKPTIRSDVYIDVLSVLSQTLPTDVYLLSLDVGWLEPDEVKDLGSAVGATGGGMPADFFGGDTEQSGDVTKSASSELVAYFSAESRVTMEPEQFIEREVIRALQKARAPGSQKRLFTDVRQASPLGEVWRDSKTGKRVDKENAESPARFFSFRAYGIVNISSGGE